MGKSAKMRFGHNLWLGGPIDTRSMRLNCFLQDIFRDAPLDHIWHTQIRAQIRPNMPNTVFGVRIWARQIWSGGVSLKRSCKMQFRKVKIYNQISCLPIYYIQLTNTISTFLPDGPSENIMVSLSSSSTFWEEEKVDVADYAVHRVSFKLHPLLLILFFYSLSFNHSILIPSTPQ